jgi:hypothetical protein
MSSSSTPALRTDRPLTPRRPDRLPVAVAAPIVLALAVLCWVAVWQVARLVF